jgi:hypothetical protein
MYSTPSTSIGLTGTLRGSPLFLPVVVMIFVLPKPRHAIHEVRWAILSVDC